MHGMSSREERVARNEATARDINEQIEDAHEDSPPSRYLRMICECGHATCERVIAMTIGEHAQLRSRSERFAVLGEHVIDDIERVVDETDRYMVVEKRDGTAADVAAEEDGRT